MTKQDQKLEEVITTVMLLMTIAGTLFAKYVYDLPAPKKPEISAVIEKQ